jgi:hypothetical protein
VAESLLEADFNLSTFSLPLDTLVDEAENVDVREF